MLHLCSPGVMRFFFFYFPGAHFLGAEVSKFDWEFLGLQKISVCFKCISIPSIHDPLTKKKKQKQLGYFL